MLGFHRMSSVAAVAIAVLFGTPALAQGPGNQPPPGVTIETVKPIDLPITYEYAGRVVASREVQVRARVGGILLQRAFEEGARVKQGDLLFKIDSASYQAQVALAKANLLEAQANLAQSQRSEERARALTQRGASSQANLDNSTSAVELAQAQVEAAQAQLRTANLSLDYATVQAPVGGITSLEQVPEGSLLSTGDLLTTITQLDPINVNFSAADTEAASIRELLESGALAGATKPSDLKVTVAFGDGTTYPESGTIDFTSTTVDSSTGTILSRAVLPNPKSQLLPGQFVRLKLEGLTVKNAITLPTEALMQGPQGTFVYTIDADNVAGVAPITVERQLPESILVSDGLKAGDRVVVKGVIKVRPGQPVDPVATMEAGENGSQAQGEDGGQAKKGAAEPTAASQDAAQPTAASDGKAPKGALGKQPPAGAAEDISSGGGEPASDGKESASGPAGGKPFTAFADTGVREEGAGPPVPRSALPSGNEARDATHGVSERAELSR